MRGVTGDKYYLSAQNEFLLTRLMRGVTLLGASGALCAIISTHTPHARRDENGDLIISIQQISTHTPHARRDSFIIPVRLLFVISTHTPHARRDERLAADDNRQHISTHTPHARRDALHAGSRKDR